MSRKKSKQKKQKVVYYDDNSPIADMSSVTDIAGRKKRSADVKPKSTAKEKWTTYFTAVKKMVFPMMVVLAVLLGLYLLIMLLSGNL